MKTQFKFWYIYKSKCYKTYTQGHCPNKTNFAVYTNTNPIPNFLDVNPLENPWGCGGASFKTPTLYCPPPTTRNGNDCVYNIKCWKKNNKEL
jgi:hypothetical protein